MNALGMDLSQEGIRRAAETYGHTGAKFMVGDVRYLPEENLFDCVYSRSLSLYNQMSFVEDRTVTDLLMRHVRPGGVLIFDYYTKLNTRTKSPDWLYHSMDAAKRHFSCYPGGRVYFSLRLDAILLGTLTFSISDVNAVVSRITGIGGDLIAIAPKN